MGFGWHNWVSEWVKRTPDAPAVVGPSETLSFKQLEWRGRKFAAALANAGVKRGDVVVVRMPRELDAVFTLALSMLGVTSASNTAKQYYDFEPITDWLLTRKPVEGYPESKQILITPMWIQRAFNNQDGLAATDAELPGFASEEDLIRLIFTSGTTGTPKAVPFSCRQMSERQRRESGTHPHVGVSLTLFDMGTTGGLARAVSEWRCGLPYLHFGEKRDGRDIVQLSKLAKIERIYGSPAQIKGFLETFLSTPFDFANLRELHVAGAIVPASMQRWVMSRLPNLAMKIRYGSTECGNLAWRLADPELETDFVGNLVDDAEVAIVDPAGNPLPEGELGVLRYRRKGMATEYFRNPEASAKAFRDGWFYPGDLARIVEGRLYIGGREAEVLNFGGVKIDPAQLDDIAVTDGGFREAAAFGYSGKRGVLELGFALVPPADPKFNRKNAQRGIERALAKRYRLSGPIKFLYLDELPRGQTGKVLRRDLTERAER